MHTELPKGETQQDVRDLFFKKGERDATRRHRWLIVDAELTGRNSLYGCSTFVHLKISIIKSFRQ